MSIAEEDWTDRQIIEALRCLDCDCEFDYFESDDKDICPICGSIHKSMYSLNTYKKVPILLRRERNE